MARVNIYLPDELAAEARDADLNVSGLTQDAVRRALEARRTDAWLDDLMCSERPRIDSGVVLAAVQAAREGLERGRG